MDSEAEEAPKKYLKLFPIFQIVLMTSISLRFFPSTLSGPIGFPN